jgi:hypothetical protein
MDSVNKTLLDYLRVQDPVLVSDKCRGGANTKSKTAKYVTPRWIDKWEDFEYDSLQSIYGGALDRVLKRDFPLKDFSAIPRIPFCEVFDENSLEALLTKWNQSVVSEALSAAQECLHKPQTSKAIYMARGGQGDFPESEKFRPDWAGVQPATLQIEGLRGSSKPWNILPGDTKVGRKWSSCDIVPGLVQHQWMPKDWIRPLSQIYTYCVKAQARYGYIISDKELVVVRIRPSLQMDDSQPTNDSQDSWQEFASVRNKSRRKTTNDSDNCDENIETRDPMLDNGRLEYKAIPWNSTKTEDQQQDCDSLTVNLALWWLHIMASVSSNIEGQYPALKEVAKPTWFGDEKRSRFVVSERTRPRSDGFPNGLPPDQTTSKRGRKRIRTDDDGSQYEKRPTRSRGL